jgi:hypothetical protein
MKKDITTRMVRHGKETRRLFKSIIDQYEDLGSDKSVKQIADDCFELGVYEMDKKLRIGISSAK